MIGWKMSQSALISGTAKGCAKSSVPAHLRIKVPKFYNTKLIKGYSKTLIGRRMNPKEQNVLNLLHSFPRILKVDGRVVGADLRMGKFQLDFDNEEDIMEELKNTLTSGCCFLCVVIQ